VSAQAGDGAVAAPSPVRRPAAQRRPAPAPGQAGGAVGRCSPYADGRPIRPEYLTHRFNALVKKFDLPPIRLHDLRHGAATLALASHTDLKVIQQMLGHSSIVTTADTYTSVLPETAHRAAQATAVMVMKAARTVPGARIGGATVPHIPAAVTASGYCQT
jgi:integrase